MPVQTSLVDRAISSLDNLPDNARIVLLLGGACSGKTALIHTFLNLYENQLTIEDKDRFQLEGTQNPSTSEYAGPFKETTEVQAYLLKAQEETQGPLVLIDTPALLPKYQEAILNYLKKQKRSIDSILLVVKNSTDRVGLEEGYLIDQAVKLKADYLTGDSFFVATSFADLWNVGIQETLVESLKIKNEHFFKFNNTPLKGPLAKEMQNFQAIQSGEWDRTKKNMTELAAKIMSLPKSLKTEVVTTPVEPDNTIESGPQEPVHTKLQDCSVQVVPQTQIQANPRLTKSSSAPLSMMVVGSFISALGLAAVALAITILTLIAVGTVGLVMGGIGAAVLMGGIGLFAAGLCKHRKAEQVPTLDLDLESTQYTLS